MCIYESDGKIDKTDLEHLNVRTISLRKKKEECFVKNEPDKHIV